MERRRSPRFCHHPTALVPRVAPRTTPVAPTEGVARHHLTPIGAPSWMFAPTARALARVCREAGARVMFNVLLRDMNVDVPASDGKRIKALAQDLPCFSRTHVGEAHPNAADTDGAVLFQARRQREDTPRVGSRCKLGSGHRDRFSCVGTPMDTICPQASLMEPVATPSVALEVQHHFWHTCLGRIQDQDVYWQAFAFAGCARKELISADQRPSNFDGQDNHTGPSPRTHQLWAFLSSCEQPQNPHWCTVMRSPSQCIAYN